ncbi:hypothetical protein [Geomicrobium sediminis]|uniref:Lipoprotein n=1 Tax=Geomicrobium sediminis TaxID=1347788 RepID=A0ABS2P7U0_9BACL|nr:hypothetical protein [Geomicrobium sediminis]MBM7631477.1 hypothetical protein [Geomicrobium sediminis]
MNVSKASLIPGILTIGLLTACGQDSAQEELLDYLNGPYDEFLDMYDELSYIYDDYEDAGSQGDDEQVLEIIQTDLIPQYDEMYDHLTSLSFEEADIEALNELLIEETSYNQEAVLAEEEAYRIVLENGESADELFNERDEYYDLADEKLMEFDQLLNELMETYDVE